MRENLAISHAGFLGFRLRELILFGLLSCFSLLTFAVPESNDLMDIYHRAAEEDPQLMKSQANRKAVDESNSQATAKALLPTVSLTANVTSNFQKIELTQTDSVGIGGNSNFRSGGYNIVLTQPVFHYDRLIAMDQADQRAEQAAMDLNSTRQDLIVRVAERYFGVLAAMDNLRFSQAQKENFGQQRELMRQRYKYGEIAIIDVSEADAGYDRAVADEIESQQQLNDAKAALREITGEYYETLTSLAQDIPLINPQPLDEKLWTQQALEQNPRVAAAALAAKVTSNEIVRRSAEHLPTFDLTATNGYSETGGQFGAYNLAANTVGLVMNMSLFEGGQTISRQREAAHRHDEALASLKQEQRAVQRQTRDAYYGVVTGVSRVQALEQTLKSQELSVKSVRSGIEVGSRTSLDLVITMRDWYRVQRDYAKARYDYLLNTLRLKRSAGILEDADLSVINSFLIHSANAGKL